MAAGDVARRQDLTTPDAVPAASPRAAFAQLLADIEAARARLADWKALAERLGVQYARDVAPLHEAYDALRAELVERLDALASGGERLSHPERVRLHGLIAQLAGELEESGDAARGAAMRRLRTYYAPDASGARSEDVEPDRPVRRSDDGVAATADAGTPPDDDPATLADRAEAQARAAAEQAEAARAAHRARRTRQAKERVAQAEARDTAVPLREVYRRLASQLHPDREPDPAERERKTGLMQRANRAYEAGQLLELLEIQQALASAESSRLAQMNDEAIARYNRLLESQLADLQTQWRAEQQRLAAAFGLPPHPTLTAARFEADLRARKQSLVAAQKGLRQLLQALEAPGALREWLRQERVWEREEAATARPSRRARR
ncbi:J domain-containing protein [uncultured Pseudacidovorax sp.]|uniref:J domain-containing protein n=1 Tax=uncultured Pseudacidovorax sp. TaxID=679313 RepID=UPI0025F5B75B|nr:J domain-containing protein [uncultured Pseudacidovorax sp.]